MSTKLATNTDLANDEQLAIEPIPTPNKCLKFFYWQYLV